ncbi:hypothetical protein AGMMS49992_14030 [Clostridia bacterium]|nr:hypothetical protein AGMMS49992_14030 [Clostridia bacterium]
MAANNVTTTQQADRLLELCDRILGYLAEAQRGLSSARNWGIFDILGGGIISTFIKHHKVDSVQSCLEAANPLLRQLGNELRQIGPVPELYVERGGFAEFADFFFDGFLADMFMQSKINQLRQQVDDTYYNMMRVRDALVETRRYAIENGV